MFTGFFGAFFLCHHVLLCEYGFVLDCCVGTALSCGLAALASCYILVLLVSSSVTRLPVCSVCMWCSHECPLAGCPFAVFCVTPRQGHVWLVCVTCLVYFSVFFCHI